MRINIIGCGPTAMSIAWSLRKTPNEIHIYDKKDGPGGSWWEPKDGTRDIHADRVLFKNAYLNVVDMLNEMDLNWDDYFHVEQNEYTSTIKKLTFKDYLQLLNLTIRVLLMPNKYKTMSLHDSLDQGQLSSFGKKLLENLPLILDGVTWEVMTAWEFVQGFNFVGLDIFKPYTQSKSGVHLNNDIMSRLTATGVNFHFNCEVSNLKYNKGGGFQCDINNEYTISEGILILCVDPGPAMRLIKDNWGPGARSVLADSIYGSVCVLFEYDNPIETRLNSIDNVINSEWSIITTILPDKKTISCVITRPITVGPDQLESEIIRQINLPKPRSSRICWGTRWVSDHWEYDQTSMAFPKNGTLPFFGKSPSVALCGMMTDRRCPFASMEAATEVGRKFTYRYFGGKSPKYKFTISLKILFTILVLLYVRYVCSCI